MNLSLLHLVPWDIILHNVMDWRNAQPEILRNPTPLTWADQLKYKELLLTDDCRRYSNQLRMWPITSGGTMVAWAGLTHMVRDDKLRSTAELSLLTSPDTVADPIAYSTILVYFLNEITPLFFINKYWQGYRLYSETYDVPGRELHIGIMDKHMVREGVRRHQRYHVGRYYDIIDHGLLKSDWESRQ